MSSMPSQVTMIANAVYHAAVANALAFSGGSFLFPSLGEEERNKQNAAKDKFQEYLTAWNKRKAERAEFLATRQNEMDEAAATNREILHGLAEYKEFLDTRNMPVDKTLDPEPTLLNYYTFQRGKNSRNNRDNDRHGYHYIYSL